jgi:D-alanyl-D-alanine carboxypeptidase
MDDHMTFIPSSNRSRGVALLLASFGIISGVAAQSKPKPSKDLFSPKVSRQLDSDLTTLMRKENLPSVEVTIQQPGKGSYSFVRGMANLKKATPRKTNQPFRIASITKPFAAVAILILVDRGKIHPDDTISKWYPSFPNASTITIGDLLKMRSGIPAPNDDEVLARVYDAPLAAAPSFDDEMRSYDSLRSQFKQPNTEGVYTDFNYDILAAIAERVSHQDIGTLITQDVLEPLKLSHSSYPTGTGVPGGLRGYGFNPSTKKFEDKTLFNPPLAGAAGAVISNAQDLHTFVRALCRGTMLKPETFRYQMEAKPLEGTNASYGAGVATGSGVCGHSGTIDGYSSDMYYFEKFDTTLTVSVTRLDRDNHSRSASVLSLVSHTMLSSLESTR